MARDWSDLKDSVVLIRISKVVGVLWWFLGNVSPWRPYLLSLISRCFGSRRSCNTLSLQLLFALLFWLGAVVFISDSAAAVNMALPLGVICINLPRHQERRTHMEELSRDMGLDIQFVQGLDGEYLKNNCAGRWKHQGNGICRVSYNTADKTSRSTRTVRFSEKTYRKSLGDVFCVHGATQEHINALRRAQDLLSQAPPNAYCIVAEDDWLLPCNFPSGRYRLTSKTSAATFTMQMYLDLMAKLNQDHSHWSLVQLGGESIPTYAPETRNEVVDRQYPGLQHAEFVAQAHAYCIKYDAIQDILLYLRVGCFPDNAICNVTRRDDYRGRSFWCDPPLVKQGAFTSSTLAANVKLAARRSFTYSAADRGVKNISKKALSGARKAIGKLGGAAKAGGGSTSAQVKRKVNTLRRATVGF